MRYTYFLMQRSVSEVSKSDNITDKVTAKVKGKFYSIHSMKKITEKKIWKNEKINKRLNLKKWIF